MRTLIVVPVLHRPHRVAPLVEAIEAATPEPHDVLFVANDDDRDELAAIREARADVLEVGADRISYPCKVNDAYRGSDHGLLFLAADDLKPHRGWLTAAQALLGPGVGVVGTNDLGNPRVLTGEHSTHSLVTRTYADDPGASIDGPGTVLGEAYRHCFCDDELVGLARARGVYRHAHDAHVEHLHPYFKKATSDPTYRLGQRSMRTDARRFQRRSLAWT